MAKNVKKTTKRKTTKSDEAKKKQLRNTIIKVSIFLLICVLVYIFRDHPIIDELIPQSSPTAAPTQAVTEQATPTSKPSGSQSQTYEELYVYFLDVGQADSIFLMVEDDTMLIDGGNNGDGKYVAAYLKELGVTELDYVIATHPDEDHIGGLDVVINAFKVGQVFLPNQVADTGTYRDMMKAIDDQSLGQGTNPNVGDTFSFGQGLVTILSVEENQSDPNDASIVCRLDYGDSSFMFTGDCSVENEIKMLKSGLNLDVDVLKVAHHGSDTSSDVEFMQTVSPEISIISVGEGNKHKHPCDVTLETLEDVGTKLYRTDYDNTILIITDGNQADGTEYEISFIDTNLDTSQMKK